MDRKEIKILFFCLVICIITGYVVYRMVANQQNKIAVVDAVKLFDGYNMKKELEEMAKEKLQAESKQIDSISNLLQMAQAVKKPEDEIKALSSAYSYMKTKLDNDYTQSNHDINEQVWKRLNPLIDEYGRKKGFHLVIGANGMGSVLYNDDYYDHTNEVIEYVNKKYAEGN